MLPKEFDIIVKTFQGLEEVLAKELTELGANNIELQRRAVKCTGDIQTLYRANFRLRTASRILVPIASFRANNPDEVYELVKKIDWTQYMSGQSVTLHCGEKQSKPLPCAADREPRY